MPYADARFASPIYHQVVANFNQFQSFQCNTRTGQLASYNKALTSQNFPFLRDISNRGMSPNYPIFASRRHLQVWSAHRRDHQTCELFPGVVGSWLGFVINKHSMGIHLWKIMTTAIFLAEEKSLSLIEEHHWWAIWNHWIAWMPLGPVLVPVPVPVPLLVVVVVVVVGRW